MSELQSTFTEIEMVAIRSAADEAGMTVDEFVAHAASAELRRRYVLPKKEGQLLQLPPRGKGSF